MEVIFLSLVGVFAGLMSGFFGVGGGTITVPALIFLSFSIKQAIAISSMQMFVSSVFGSFLNHKNGQLNIKQAMPFLYGGLIGGPIGAHSIGFLPEKLLYSLFLLMVILAIIRVFFSPSQTEKPEIYSFWLYVLIGTTLGIASGMLGIGGAILLTPILVGFLNFDIKKAISVSLFFVIASSLAALVEFIILKRIDYASAIVVASLSVVGSYIGIKVSHKVDSKKHKKLLILIYIAIFITLLDKALSL